MVKHRRSTLVVDTQSPGDFWRDACAVAQGEVRRIRRERDQARAALDRCQTRLNALQALTQPPASAGWRLVPPMPTAEMAIAFRNGFLAQPGDAWQPRFAAGLAAAVAAAPAFVPGPAGQAADARVDMAQALRVVSR